MTEKRVDEIVNHVVKILLNESQMACMKYFPKVRKIARHIIKTFYDDYGELKDKNFHHDCFLLNLTSQESVGVYVYSPQAYENVFSHVPNTYGLYRNGDLHIKLIEDLDVTELTSTIMHELEHYMDYKNKRAGRYYSLNSPMFASYDPEAIKKIRFLLYALFSRTEFNAFSSSFLSDNYWGKRGFNHYQEPPIFKQMQLMLNDLKGIPYQGHEWLWHWVDPDYDPYCRIEDQSHPKARKHFLRVAQSKLDHLREVTYRKYMNFKQRYRRE